MLARVRRRGDGVLYLQRLGVTSDGRGAGSLRVIEQAGRFLAVKVPSHRVWDGHGYAPRYIPASFEVFERVDGSVPTGAEPENVWRSVLSFPVRA